MLSRMGYEMRVAVIKFNSSLFVFNFGRSAYVCVCVCVRVRASFRVQGIMRTGCHVQ